MRQLCVKGLTASFIIGSIFLVSAFAATSKEKVEADYNTKGITINYGIVDFPQNEKPFKMNSIVYVPLAFFAETLGFKVEDYLDNYINIDGGDVLRYSTQSDLLKDAMDYIGVNAPEKAVDVWSEGLKHRNAAIQYSVMTKELKEVYVKDLEKEYANWVTGVSSPWVEDYKIINKEKRSNKTQVFEVQYSTSTSGGEFESFTVILEVLKEGDFWRISKVKGDEMSAPYTGFTI